MFKIEIKANGGWIVPAYTQIDAGFEAPAWSELGDGCKLGPYCELGHNCELGPDCTLGDGCKLGHGCKLGDGCKLGHGCKLGPSTEIGENPTWLGVTVQSWLTLANVDGTGMYVTMVKHADGVMVNAGCFLGTLDEFIEKVIKRSMNRYVAVISAVAAAM